MNLGIYVFAILFLALSKCDEAPTEDCGWNRIERTGKDLVQFVGTRLKK